MRKAVIIMVLFKKNTRSRMADKLFLLYRFYYTFFFFVLPTALVGYGSGPG